MALYVENEDGTHFLDEDGNKIEYTIKYPSDVVFIDQPDFFVNDKGHIESSKNIVIKQAEDDNHAVVKSQVSDIVRDSFLDLWVSEYLRMYSSCTYQMDRADGSTVKMKRKEK